MEKVYELVIFTASIPKYADPLMDILDKKKLCSYRLFRESCTMLSGYYVKELKRMNRSLKDVILLDVLNF
jgi:carboxy-terminal domain RNA polymerase II polypeptide A small phosphatase